MTFLSSLKFRIFASYLLAVLFAAGVTALLTDRALERRALRDLEASVEAQAALAAAQLDPAALRRGSAVPEAALARLAPGPESRLTVISASGKVLGDSRLSREQAAGLDNHLDRPEVLAAAAGRPAGVSRRSGTLGGDMLYLAVPVRDAAGIAGFARLALPSSRVERLLSEVRRVAALSFALSAVFALLLGWGAAALLSRRLAPVLEGARRFSSGDLEHRIRSASDDELGALAATLDSMAGEIADRVREAGLRRLELEAAFRDMPEAILLADGAGVVTMMNPRARQLMGVKGFEPLGLRLSELPGGHELSSAALKALTGGKPVSFEYEPPAAPGTAVAVAASPLAEGGAVRGCVLLARDVTGPRRLESMRREFVANVSHELRTPLTAIKGSAETLLGGALEDREHGPQFARSIFEQAVRLEKLVADLLKLSYSESGRDLAEKRPVRLAELAAKAVSAVAAAAAARGVRLANEVPEALVAPADRDKVEQVLINLLDNAVKYGAAGGRVRIKGADEGAAARIVVEDEGPGIAAAHLPHIFERFYRADKARSRELGGTGLGLSIARRLVELHGGSVGVDSAEGRGSAFWFTLPK